MATLQSMLILTLRDQVSAPAAKISAALGRIGAIGERGGKVAKQLNFGQTSLVGGLNLHTGNLKQSIYDWDNLQNQIRAITEASETQMGSLRDRIGEVSGAVGVMPQELLEAAKGWIELGNSIESYNSNVMISAAVSRITGVTVGEQMKESSALMRAFGFSMDDTAAFKHFEEVYLVASKGMYGGARAYGEAAKAFAPVAKSMRLSLEETSALVQTLGGQFQAGEIGNALKTGFTRLMSPRSGALANLAAASIDVTSLFKLDHDRLGSEGGSAFAERLSGMGKTVSPAFAKQLEQIFAETDTRAGGRVLRTKLTEALTNEFGRVTKSGRHILDGESSKEFSKGIAQMFQQFSNGVDLKEFMRVMGGQAGALRQDEFREKGADALIQELTPALGELPESLQAQFRDAFANTDLQKNGYLLREKLKDLIKGSFGEITPEIADKVMASFGAVFDKFSTGANTPLLDALFGVNRLPQFMDLLRQYEHLTERIESIQQHAPGALDRKWAIFDNEGYARSMDHLSANWDNFWKKMAGSGVGDDAAFLIQTLADIIKKLEGMDSGLQRVAFWAVAIGAAFASWKIARPIAGLLGGGGVAAAGAAAAGAAAGGTAVASRGLIGRILRSKTLWGAAALGAYAWWDSAHAEEADKKPDAKPAEAAGAKAKETWGQLYERLSESLLGLFLPADLAKGRDGRHRAWDEVAAKLSGKSSTSGAAAVAGGNAVATGRDADADKAAANVTALEPQAQGAVTAIDAAMNQVRSIVAAVDLTAEGRRIAETLAAGIRSGTSSIAAAAQAAADAASHAAVRGAYSDGGIR